MSRWMLLNLVFFMHMIASDMPPNIKFIGYSYNAMEGNPNAIGETDIGWNMQNNIFDLSANGQTCLTNYTCPNGVAAISSMNCNRQISYFRIIAGSNDYHHTLINQMSLETNYTATFSGSHDFQHVLKTTESKSNQNVYTTAIYTCRTLQYSIENIKNMNFTQKFIQDIKNLPNTYGGNEDYFYKFLTNSYGTHYANTIDMGCIAGQLSQMSSFQFSKFDGSNLQISDAALYSALKANGGSSLLNSTEKKQASDFQTCTVNQYEFNYGGDQTITNGNYSEWRIKCKSNPVPINQTSLFEIYTLLTAENFPNISDINQKQTAMINALYNYCTEYAKRNTDLEIDCNGWPNDLPVPKLSIISGLVPNIATGWNEPVNPYTGMRSCPIGTNGVNAFGVWNPANNAEKILVKMCIHNNYGITDPLGYFGGIYSDGSIKMKNNFTSNFSCPKGFDDYIFMGCPTQYELYSNVSSQCIKPHICYNSSMSLDESIIGGFYTNSSDADCEKNNQYTHSKNCPSEFKPYNIGQTACGKHPGMYATMFVCLNNVYQL
eukprot:70962_1